MKITGLKWNVSHHKIERDSKRGKQRNFKKARDMNSFHQAQRA